MTIDYVFVAVDVRIATGKKLYFATNKRDAFSYVFVTLTRISHYMYMYYYSE